MTDQPSERTPEPVDTLQAVQDAITAHLVDMKGSGIIPTAWVVAVEYMDANGQFTTTYISGHQSPAAAVGVLHMASDELAWDLDAHAGGDN